MKLVGIMLTLVVLGLLIYLTFGRRPEGQSSTATVGTALGAGAPVDVAQNPAAARLHSERQACLGNCAAEFHTCKAVALEDPQMQACNATNSACEKRCP